MDGNQKPPEDKWSSDGGLIRSNFIEPDAGALSPDSTDYLLQHLNRINSLRSLNTKSESQLSRAKSTHEKLIEREEKKLYRLLQKESRDKDLDKQNEQEVKQNTKRIAFALPPEESFITQQDNQSSCSSSIASTDYGDCGLQTSGYENLDTAECNNKPEEMKRFEYDFNPKEANSEFPQFQVQSLAPEVLGNEICPSDCIRYAYENVMNSSDVSLDWNSFPIKPILASENTFVSLGSTVCSDSHYDKPEEIKRSIGESNSLYDCNLKVTKSEGPKFQLQTSVPEEFRNEIYPSDFVPYGSGNVKNSNENVSLEWDSVPIKPLVSNENSFEDSNFENLISPENKNVQQESKPKSIVKRPFLKKRAGLTRFFKKESDDKDNLALTTSKQETTSKSTKDSKQELVSKIGVASKSENKPKPSYLSKASTATVVGPPKIQRGIFPEFKKPLTNAPSEKNSLTSEKEILLPNLLETTNKILKPILKQKGKFEKVSKTAEPKACSSPMEDEVCYDSSAALKNYHGHNPFQNKERAKSEIMENVSSYEKIGDGYDSASSVTSTLESLSDSDTEIDDELHLFELMEAMTQDPTYSQLPSVANVKKFVSQDIVRDANKQIQIPNKEVENQELVNKQLMSENGTLKNCIGKLEHENDLLHQRIQTLHDARTLAVNLEKGIWNKEKQALLKERDLLLKEKDLLVNDKMSLVSEKKDLLKAKERVMRERDCLKKEKELWLIEKNEMLLDKRNWMMDKEQLLNDKKTLVADKRRSKRKDSFSNDSPLKVDESRLPNGDVAITLSNGTTKYVTPEGQEYKYTYRNGDFQENHSDGTIKYFFQETKTWRITQADGIKVTKFNDGQTETEFPTGLRKVVYPNHIIRNIKPNGTEELIYPDATKVVKTTDGRKTFTFPNGQMEFHTDEYIKRLYPDKTVKILYKDGSTETKWINGRVRVKDPSGTLIYDTGEPPLPEYLTHVVKYIGAPEFGLDFDSSQLRGCQ